MSSVKGQLFAITGAASGIGRATSQLLGKNGDLLSLADKDGEAVERFAKELTDSGVNVFWKRVDVCDRNAVDEWVGDTVRKFGRALDGAANLAGISGRLGPVRDHDSADYEAVFAVNVTGVFNCMSAELRNMRAAEGNMSGGSIVNAASIVGLVGKPSCSVYCASKFAVVGITKAAAREEADTGIRVNAIAPGFVQTPLMERLDADLGFELPNDAVLGRRARPEEIAKLIMFLLSEDSSYTTGSVYQIDGGMLC
ncbi:putative short chain dehydrogenase/ reductase [Lophiostoma macrostomum CBS 122681]|uniref:Putative short chain dehydrogenase/ reductase n=1 Tax=Lophiostoma macrostomum CBS 122681 TaxID=1314788 RepID=A0A6A6TF40_9PLEO|nr:putative short chain dehydrogenase/ reductase [Lophiostoma macrostomum CBS 122681]